MTDSVACLPGKNDILKCLRGLDSSWLAVLFFFCALPNIIFLAITTPPFQSPDEVAHFYRAYQVSHGVFAGTQPGIIDPAIDQLLAPYESVAHQQREQVMLEEQREATLVRWGDKREERYFTNTAAYTPLHYMPQAIGVFAGRALGLSVYHTMQLGRLLNGVTALAIGMLALGLCRGGRYVMFGVLLLPMSLSLYASFNQDATIIPMAALCCALVSRLMAQGRAASHRELGWLAAISLFVVLGRPPYAPMLLIFLMPGLIEGEKKRSYTIGCGIIALVLAATLAWLASGALSHAASVENTNPKEQVLYLAHHIFLIPMLMIKTIGAYTRFYTSSFIGNLGWLDTEFPDRYYLLALLMLGAAMIAECLDSEKKHAGQSAFIGVVAFLAILSLFLAEYIIGTSVGGSAIISVQGRYLIPLAFLVGIALPHLRAWPCARDGFRAVVVLFPLVTFFYLPQLIIERYYMAGTNHILEKYSDGREKTFGIAAIPVSQGTEVKQIFRQHLNSMSGVDVQWITWGRQQKSYLIHWTLRDVTQGAKNAAVKAEGDMNGRDVGDWKFYTLSFPRIENSRDHLYQLDFTCVSGPVPNKSMGLPLYKFKNDAKTDYEVELNGKPFDRPGLFLNLEPF